MDSYRIFGCVAVMLACCLLSIFFGYGGIRRRALFVKLCKRKGIWRRQGWHWDMLFVVGNLCAMAVWLG